MLDQYRHGLRRREIARLRGTSEYAVRYHLRNITGKVPTYKESFIDDGDVDILRVMQILHRNGFDGVLIPDHAPQMECAAPWHAGMAFALGYMRAAIQACG